jgi:hypothetical protein
MKSLKSELELVQSLRAELGQLKTQVAEMGTLKAQVEALTGELQGLRMRATSTADETQQSSSRDLSEPAPSPIPSSPLDRKEPG